MLFNACYEYATHFTHISTQVLHLNCIMYESFLAESIPYIHVLHDLCISYMDILSPPKFAIRIRYKGVEGLERSYMAKYFLSQS